MPDLAAVTQFFQTYQDNSNHDDPRSLVAQFADTFLAAGPEGAVTLRAEQFAAVLLRRKALFRERGCDSSHLLSVTPRPLSDRYLLAETQWLIHFRPAGQLPRDLTVSSTFLLDTGSDPWKILFYLAHQDPLAQLDQQT